jgi:ABC-type sugar transport system ATPase subunit
VSRVSLDRVVKRYGRTEAVRGISFDVEDGELLVVLGPSGCGKTSTLRMIAGLEKVTAGDITFDGRRVNDVPPARRNVAMAFENYGLYEHWPVYENIAYPLRLRGGTDRDVDRTVRTVAETLHLSEWLDERPGGLSGGLRQRIGLARALVRQPSVFLLDEPMSHVDADLRNDMRAELKRIHVDTGATMIIVTHDQLDALAMADRIVVMDDGHIEQHGRPEEVYDRPASAFVAGFIGEPAMNLLPAAPAGPPGVYELATGGRVAMPDAEGSLAPVTVGFRPHTVHLLPGSAPDPAGAGLLADGTVYMLEPLGDRTLVTVRCGTQLVKADLPGRAEAELEDRIRLQVVPRDLRLFDAASGRARAG